ncbi:MAG TPA: VWA domain-containing protein [Thermoanaerobaculia bacterium]|jgi:VWFA-related protein
MLGSALVTRAGFGATVAARAALGATLPARADFGASQTSASLLRATILLASLALLAPAASGQTTSSASSPGVHETAAAVVVEIPVTVVGKDGRPVTGLTAADFELFDEGKKQAISGVDVIDLSQPVSPAPPAAGPAVAAAPPIPPAARRLWLLVFDLSYASPSGLVRAREGARDFVSRSMKENDLAAVGTLSVDTGWRLLVNFTRDRRQLVAAVDTPGIPSLIHPSPDPLVFAFSDPRAAEAGVEQNPNGSLGAQALQDAMRDMQVMRRKSNDELLRGRATKQVASLAGIGRVLDSVRGRKHVVFFSEGFESRLINGNALAQAHDGSIQAQSAQDPTTAMGAGDASLSGEIWKIDNDARFGSSSSRDLLSSALAQFSRSDAVVDAVDIGGLRAEGDPAPKNEGGTDTLFTMAADTGGDFVRNANQLAGELEKIVDRTSLVYLIVYNPRGLTKPGAFHTLKVTVKSPGARVAARSGYYEPRPYRALSRLEQVLSAGDLLSGGGGASQQIETRLTAAAFASPSDLPQVPIVLEVPGASLLAGDSGEKSGVQIYAYANDAKGNLMDYVASELALDLGKVRASLEASGLKFYGTLYLPPGEYGLRVLVRNASTGRAGIASERLTVPPIPGGPPSVLPPFFSEADGHWLMVRATPRADAPARPADYPFALAGESFIPAALPRLDNGADARIAVVAYNFGSSGKPAPLAVDLRIVGADGKEMPAAAKAEKASDLERGGGQKRFYSFHPSGLPPGRYALKVVVTDTATHSSAESASPFDIK